jgi:hypothetical protein
MHTAFMAAWQMLQAVAPYVVCCLIPSLLNAVLRYPRRSGFARWLHIVLDVLSVLARRDSPGTLKLPLTTSSAPWTGVDPPLSRSLKYMNLLVAGLLVTALAACSPASRTAWKETGIDLAKCATPTVAAASAHVVLALLDAAKAEASVDRKALGQRLATQYGPDAALCAVDTLWRQLAATPLESGGLAPLSMEEVQENRLRVGVAWLASHPTEWAFGR